MFSNQASRIKTKSYKHRKKWLVSKVHDLKKQYDDILTAFKQRLDRIVNPILEDATRVLSFPDEDAFLKEVYDVGIGIEKCSSDLFEISLFSVGNNFSSDDDEDSESSETENSVQALTITSSPPSNSTVVNGSLELTLNAHHASKTTNTTPKFDTEVPPPVVNSNSKKLPNSSIETPEDPPEPIVDTIPNSDIDLLLLHNIKIGEKMPVLVSDVINPSQFSVQPEESKQQLVDLQRELNALYTQQWTDQLKFKESPIVGTICVALFTIDHCWYRAKILKEEPNEKYEVIYIDYGNHNIVKKDDLRIIDPGFGNIPQLSIQCSLFGIEPAANKGEPCMQWSLPSTEWFDSQVFGKWFTAQFARNATSTLTPRYSVHLFIEKETVGGKTSSWSVADNLVCMGFAAFTNHMSEHTANSESDTKQHKEHSLMAHTPAAQRNLLKQLSAVARGEITVIPAGYESSNSTSPTCSRNHNMSQNSTSPRNDSQRKGVESTENVLVGVNARHSLSSLTICNRTDKSSAKKRLSLSSDRVQKL